MLYLCKTCQATFTLEHNDDLNCQNCDSEDITSKSQLIENLNMLQAENGALAAVKRNIVKMMQENERDIDKIKSKLEKFL